ncbi:MAG TPA: hypothetical protein VK709_06965, partial [Candidatus Saccharimonadales bacterium]|nr:hypothetical protein [Candidatus Saccharimonadales bacterium]
PVNKIGILDTCKTTLSECCVDPLRPPRFSETGTVIGNFLERGQSTPDKLAQNEQNGGHNESHNYIPAKTEQIDPKWRNHYNHSDAHRVTRAQEWEHTAIQILPADRCVNFWKLANLGAGLSRQMLLNAEGISSREET